MKNLKQRNWVILFLLATSSIFSTIDSIAQIVINEVNHWPTSAQGMVGSGTEYIELYNTSCSSVDISCFILSARSAPNSNPSSTLATGGSILIPQGTVIGPKGHFVIGTSLSSSDPAAIDFKTDLNTSFYCNSGNFVLTNSDGWLALYNGSGTPIDAIYWTTLANQSTKISTDDDYDDAPCTPASSAGCSTSGITLLSAKDIYVSYPALITYVGQTNGTPTSAPTSSTGKTFSRMPDGGAWQRDVTASIVGSNCNDGNCASCCNFLLNAAVTQPSCNSSDGGITFNPSPSDVYFYTWPFPTSGQVNSVNNLASGSYFITITSQGGCSKDTTIVLNPSAGPSGISVTTNLPTCGLTNGSVSLGAVTGGVGPYTYNFNSLGFSSVNSYTNLINGTYSLQVKDANGCVFNAPVVVLNGVFTPIVATATALPNTNCSGASAPCNYSGPSILINEINIYPNLNDGSIYGPGPGGAGSGEGEWIELYNPDWCDSVDISGYILGSYNSTGSNLTTPYVSNGMAYVLPQGTKVPPSGFVVVRGSNAPVPPAGVVDVVIQNNGGLCIDGGVVGSRMWFQNAGGWFAFYDRNGVAQDVISWGAPTSSDLAGRPCIPSVNSLPGSVTQLPTYNETGLGINLGTSSIGQTFVRIPDGGSWSSSSASENFSYGSCNVPGSCTGSGGSSTCNGSVQLNVSGGDGSLTFTWDDVLSQTTIQADSLCAGLYTVVIEDTNGCQVTVQQNVIDQFFTLDAQIQQPGCQASTGSITAQPNPTVGNYSYSWSSNTGISNTTSTTASGLANGTYSVVVSDGGCSRDTTIILTGPPAITGVDVSVQDASCGYPIGIIYIDVVTGGTAPYDYSINNQSFPLSGNDSIPNLNAGSYSVQITDSNNCTYTVNAILIGDTPVPTNADLTILNASCGDDNGVVQVVSVNGGTAPYLFAVNGGSFDTTSVFNNVLAGNYIIQVQDVNGCQYQEIVSVSDEVIFQELVIPNVFTPNNDGTNDVWDVEVSCVESFSCNILNRWGNVVYSFTDPSGSWDGKTQNEDSVADGVYFYRIDLTYSNGKTELYHGNITVIN